MDDTHLFPEPSLNPKFMAMSAEELIAHHNRNRRMAHFTNVALVFAVCERRLTEAEELVHEGDKCLDMLWDKIIRAREA